MLKAKRSKATKKNGQLVQDIGTLPLSGQGCPACPKIFSQRGQQVLEYAVVVLAVVAAYGVMKIYAQRGLQAFIKSSADQIGLQNESLEQTRDDGYDRTYIRSDVTTQSQDRSRANATGMAFSYNTSSASVSGGMTYANSSELIAVGYTGT